MQVPRIFFAKLYLKAFTNYFKIEDGMQPPSWKRKNQDLKNRSTNFNEIWHADASGPPDIGHRKLELLDLRQDSCHLEKKMNCRANHYRQTDFDKI